MQWGAQGSTFFQGPLFQSPLHGTSTEDVGSGPLIPNAWHYEKLRGEDGDNSHLGLEERNYHLHGSEMGAAISMIQGHGEALLEQREVEDGIENGKDTGMTRQANGEEDFVLWPDSEDCMIDLDELEAELATPASNSQGSIKIEGSPALFMGENRGRGNGLDEHYLQDCLHGSHEGDGRINMKQEDDWRGSGSAGNLKPGIEDVKVQQEKYGTILEMRVENTHDSGTAQDLMDLGSVPPMQESSVLGPQFTHTKADESDILDGCGLTEGGLPSASAVVELSDSDDEKDTMETLDEASGDGMLGQVAFWDLAAGGFEGSSDAFLEGSSWKRKLPDTSSLPVASKRAKADISGASALHNPGVLDGRASSLAGLNYSLPRFQEPRRPVLNYGEMNRVRVQQRADQVQRNNDAYAGSLFNSVRQSAADFLKSSSNLSTQPGSGSGLPPISSHFLPSIKHDQSLLPKGFPGLSDLAMRKMDPLGILQRRHSYSGPSASVSRANSEAVTPMLPGGFAPGSLHAIRAGFGSMSGYAPSNPGALTVGARQDVDATTSSALIGVMEGLQVCQMQEEADVPVGLLRMPLLKHQKLALAWMEKRESSYPAGGILADDQGLGKTISTISLILKARSPNGIGPSSGPANKQPVTVNLEDDYAKGNREFDGTGNGKDATKGHSVNVITLIDEDDDKGHAREARGGQFLSWHGNSGRNAEESKVSEAGYGSENAKVEEQKPLQKEKSKYNSKRIPGGTLVVCPTSVLRQWASELKDKVESKANLSVLIYHGSNRIRNPEELASYGVVLTTYAIVAMEVPKQPTAEELAERKNGGQVCTGGAIVSTKPKNEGGGGGTRGGKGQKGSTGRRRGKRKVEDGEDEDEILAPGSGPLARLAWFRVVLDEAQSIKNRSTQVARACWGLRAKRRWCLSGTPIQNSIDDLFSYFRFLRWHPFDEYSAFRSQIKDVITRNPGTGWKKLQSILQAVMLRRTKATLIDGKPIVSLPPRIVSLQQTEFSPEERSFYTCLEAASREQFQDYAKAGTVQSNYVNILVMLLQLRQACDHPALVKSRTALLEKGERESASEEALQAAKKLPQNHAEKLLQVVEKSNAICAVCEDAPEDPVISICAHVFCRQCVEERWAWADAIPGQCPSCKKSITNSDIFTPSALRASRTPSQDIVESPLQDRVKREAESKDNAVKPEWDMESLGSFPGSQAGGSGSDVAPSAEEERKVQTGSVLRGEDFPTSSKIEAMLETLKKLPKMVVEVDGGKMGARVHTQHMETKVEWEATNRNVEVKQEILSSSSAIVASGPQQRAQQVVEASEKAIVFSQWTSMLNLLEPQLQRAGLCYRRLDGTMSIQARDKAISDFTTRPEVSVIIMSLKAASLGLNMVAACHVLLLDVWWNPSTEDQAIDRAHRIGQTRPVRVSRFTVRNTIEDRILELQEKKRTMVASAFGENDGVNKSTRLSEDDLHFLFRA